MVPNGKGRAVSTHYNRISFFKFTYHSTYAEWHITATFSKAKIQQGAWNIIRTGSGSISMIIPSVFHIQILFLTKIYQQFSYTV